MEARREGDTTGNDAAATPSKGWAESLDAAYNHLLYYTVLWREQQRPPPCRRTTDGAGTTLQRVVVNGAYADDGDEEEKTAERCTPHITLT